jgi:hypothetical protein
MNKIHRITGRKSGLRENIVFDPDLTGGLRCAATLRLFGNPSGCGDADTVKRPAWKKGTGYEGLRIVGPVSAPGGSRPPLRVTDHGLAACSDRSAPPANIHVLRFTPTPISLPSSDYAITNYGLRITDYAPLVLHSFT